MLDRQGRKVDRRNVQDIYVPLYDKQIPPGAAQVVHYALEVPRDARGPITLEARLQYRKFDPTMMKLAMGDAYRIDLPVTTIASGAQTLPAPAGSRRTGPAGVGALERLRHRPAARRQRRQRKGRAAPGRGGVRRSRAAGPARRAAEPGPRVPQGRTARRRRRGAGAGARGRRRAVDGGVAHRSGEQGERPSRRRHRQLRGGARRHVAGAAGARLRLQPRLRGAERARPGAVRAGQAGAWRDAGRGPRRRCCAAPSTPSTGPWPSTARTSRRTTR